MCRSGDLLRVSGCVPTMAKASHTHRHTSHALTPSHISHILVSHAHTPLSHLHICTSLCHKNTHFIAFDAHLSHMFLFQIVNVPEPYPLYFYLGDFPYQNVDNSLTILFHYVNVSSFLQALGELMSGLMGSFVHWLSQRRWK